MLLCDGNNNEILCGKRFVFKFILSEIIYYYSQDVTDLCPSARTYIIIFERDLRRRHYCIFGYADTLLLLNHN